MTTTATQTNTKTTSSNKKSTSGEVTSSVTTHKIETKKPKPTRVTKETSTTKITSNPPPSTTATTTTQTTKTRKPKPCLYNFHENCNDYAAEGYCQDELKNNRLYMSKYCQRACAQNKEMEEDCPCRDVEDSCPDWVADGYCKIQVKPPTVTTRDENPWQNCRKRKHIFLSAPWGFPSY